MADLNLECFLIPKRGFDVNLPEKKFNLPNLQEVTIGRGIQFGIKDLACSKSQLIVEADISTQIVKMRRIGRNPSILAGFPMEQNQVYIAREGMILQVTPEVEFDISFKNKANFKTLNRKGSQKSEKNRKFNWSLNPVGTVLYCHTNDVVFDKDCKIAGFDLDGTLISTKSGHTFPTNDDDWKLWHSDVKVRLSKLVTEGFNLVIFTNQNQLDISSQSRKESFKNKIENIINSLDVPFIVLVAMSRDIYRKPGPGMWDYCVSKLEGRFSLESSFYVGDAAGRVSTPKVKKSGDFDITDRLFARNVEVTFYTPEEFFLNESPRAFKDVNFHPKELPTDDYSELHIPSNPSEVIIMVGSPASGKSFFVSTVLQTKGYRKVSRDELKAWTKCRDKIIEAISQHQNIVYDATNPDKESRKNVLDICHARNFTNIRCFVMTTSEERCEHNNKFRQLVNNSNPVPYSAIATFKKRFEEPTTEEGFVSIVKIPFVPKFQKLEHEELYKKYLLGRKRKN